MCVYICIYIYRIIFTSVLSLGGIRPFLGLLPKRIVIQAIIKNNIAPTTVAVTSLITLYCYLKISYSKICNLKHRIIKTNQPKTLEH